MLLVLMLAAYNSPGQEQQKHVKRTYIAPNGNLYIQKSLPIYLWLTTSPSATDNPIQLKSKVAARYSNPMFFDTEGLNLIRHDYATDANGHMVYPQQEVQFEVYADGMPPVSSSSFDNAPRYYANGKIYYGKGLTVPLRCYDLVSGVEKTWYSINGEAYKEYTGPLAMNTENASYTLKYYGSDNVGNAENPNVRNFVVDLTAPVSKHMLNGITLGDILAPSAYITLSSTDNLSGVNAIYYHLDGNYDVVYTGAIGVGYLSDGPHTFTYHAKDNVNNIEDKKPASGIDASTGGGVYNFYLDKIAPVVDYTIQGDQYMGMYKFISPRTKIGLSATDNHAGVESITYLIDNLGANTFSNPFNIPDQNGLHYINYFGTDKVKNKSVPKILAVYMDNVLPTTGITYGYPQFFDRDTLFINKSTKVSLTSYDYQSGVLKTEYEIDGGASVNYGYSFTIPDQGYRTVTFKATDRVNNIELVKTSKVFIDNTPPVIFNHFSIEPVGSKEKDGKKYVVYPNYTRLYIAATDDHVGTAQISFSVNGGPMIDYSSPYSLDISELNYFMKKNVFYSVKIVAKDKLGNATEKVIEFYVGQ